MAMNKTVLAAAIVVKLKARNVGITGASETQLQAFWEDIAGEIIDHIKANATVQVTVTTTGADPQGGSVASTGSGVGTVNS